MVGPATNAKRDGGRPWVSITARLPVPNEHVIVTDGVFVEVGMWESDYAHDYCPATGTTALYSFPTHWMLIPSLPLDS